MNFIPNTEKEKKELLLSIGVKRFEDLISNIPKESRFSLPNGSLLRKGSLSEMETVAHLESLAGKNDTVSGHASFLGAGAYHHFIPSIVNAIISRGEFLTAYTPYQPEASQGTLQAAFEFQTMISELYGMDVANASLYDGASAVAEAALLAVKETGRNKILVSKAVHPEYLQALKTTCRSYEIVEVAYSDRGTCLPAELEKHLDERTACFIMQSPNFFGCIENGYEFSEPVRKNGSLFIVSANPVSLGIYAPPGDYGADIAVGEGQPLGIPLSYGGPYLGIFSCSEKHMRKMPGRVVGMTKDLEGKRGFVLTLQTREQHIRREKATSNICTNSALMALSAAVYLSLLGPRGLEELAELNLKKSHYAAEQISKLPGFSLKFESPFFNEFVVRSQTNPEKVNRHLLKDKIIGGLPLGRFYPELSDCILFCVTEMNSKEQIDRLAGALKELK